MKKISVLFLASLLLSTQIGFASDRDDLDMDRAADTENQDSNQGDSRQSEQGGLTPEQTKSALLRKKVEIEQAIRSIVAADAQNAAKEKELRQQIKIANQTLATYQLEAEKQKKALITQMNKLKSEETAAAKADADAQVLALQKISQDLQKKKLQFAHEEMQMRKELKEMAAKMKRLIPADIDAPTKSHGRNSTPTAGIPNDPTTQLGGLISAAANIP